MTDPEAALDAWLAGGSPPDRAVQRAAVKESLAALAAVAPGTAARVLLAAVAVEVAVFAGGQVYALRR